jgi:hypothetical protein
MFSAALTFVAAAHFFTLQARSSSQRFAIVPSFLSPFHASACRPSLRQAAARQYSSLGIMPAALGSPSLSGDEHSRPADPTLLHFRLLARLAPAVASTFHEPSNSSAMLSVSSRSHSTVKHESRDRLHSNSTHQLCCSPVGPRAVAPTRLQLSPYERSAFLYPSLQIHVHFPVVVSFLLALMSSLCFTHLCHF